MRLPFLAIVLLALACSSPSPRTDRQIDEWLEVLELKKEAAEGDAVARQQFADALLEFLRRHPENGRARTVFTEMQLQLSREHAGAGRYDEAVAYLENILEREPQHDEARRELVTLRGRMRVEPDSLRRLDRGMTAAAVAEILGPPPEGWRRATDRGGVSLESWFYRNSEGGIAALHFEQGRLLAADFTVTPGSGPE